MTQENITQSGGSRRRRRGGRRSGPNTPQTRSSSPGRSHENKAESEPAKGIVGFFKKLFGIKEKPSARPQPAARRDRFEREDRSDRVDRPARPERTDRAERPSSTAAQREPKVATERREDPVSSIPEEIEVTTPKLYVGNLSYDSSESEVFDLFSKAGQVKNVEIVRDRNSNSKGFGFVEMNSIEGAKDAALKYHRFQFMDRQLIVSGARR